LSSYPLGNDIVDWQKAKSHEHKLTHRYLDKIFVDREIQYIQTKASPILAFWHLWSVKESAYKAWQRKQKSKPVFNPKSFICQNIEKKITSIQNGNFICDVESFLSPEFIYSQCKSENVHFKIIKTSEYFSCLKQKWDSQGWKIHKTAETIPFINNQARNIQFPISLSHDGDFTSICVDKKFDLL